MDGLLGVYCVFGRDAAPGSAPKHPRLDGRPPADILDPTDARLAVGLALATPSVRHTATFLFHYRRESEFFRDNYDSGRFLRYYANNEPSVVQHESADRIRYRETAATGLNEVPLPVHWHGALDPICRHCSDLYYCNSNTK